MKQKDQKKIGFWVKNDESVEALANRLNQLGYWLTDYSFPIEVRSRDTKNLLSLLVVFLSRSRVTTTCQAFNAPTASEPVDPQLDWSRLFFGFLVPNVRNL